MKSTAKGSLRSGEKSKETQGRGFRTAKEYKFIKRCQKLKFLTKAATRELTPFHELRTSNCHLPRDTPLRPSHEKHRKLNYLLLWRKFKMNL